MKMINPDVVKGMLELKPEIQTLENNERIFLTPRLFGVPQMITAGEHSKWLLPLKERAVLMGARCPKCGQVYAPAYLEYCGYAPCRFEKLELIELPDVGVVVEADPVITLFAPARMQGEAPFAHGYIELKKGKIRSDVGMMFAMQTTKGVIQPGIYKAGTPVKVVFKAKREGWVADMFCLPQKELTKAQIKKTPLFDTDINWKEPKPPKYAPTKQAIGQLSRVKDEIKVFFSGVNKSKRNQARLKSVDINVNVITGGGDFAITVRGGQIKMAEKTFARPTTALAAKNPLLFGAWTKGQALTNLFALGDLWISNRDGIRVLEDLDRLWRAAYRDGTL